MEAEELKKLRLEIIQKHLSITKEDDLGIETFFAYHQAMEEYSAIRVKQALDDRVLPTDEEIELKAFDFEDKFDDDPHRIAREGFTEGAKWMRSKIKNESQENNTNP